MAIERQAPICTEPGCRRKTLARSLCGKHYQRARNSGALPPKRIASLRERLLHGFTRDPASGCWLWMMAKDSVGYGLVTVGTGKSRGAHRESFRQFVGEIPPGIEVCHRCDVPSCINPDHLFLGTHEDNMKDCSRKGRAAGALSLAQVAEVRASNEPVSAIAKRLGVGLHVIYKCRRGDTYPENQLLEESQ